MMWIYINEVCGFVGAKLIWAQMMLWVVKEKSQFKNGLKVGWLRLNQITENLLDLEVG